MLLVPASPVSFLGVEVGDGAGLATATWATAARRCALARKSATSTVPDVTQFDPFPRFDMVLAVQERAIFILRFQVFFYGSEPFFYGSKPFFTVPSLFFTVPTFPVFAPLQSARDLQVAD